MKTMRRGFLVLLVFALAMGGASAETVLSEPGTLPLAEETIHLSVGLSQSTVVEDFDTNAQTLRLEDDLNVELEFVYYPSTAEEFIQKVELQIMAGGDELPDIIMSDLGGLNNLAMYGQMGIILPVTEYYDTIAYYTDQNMEENGLNKEDLLRYITAYDGEIYGLMRYHAYINNSLSASRMLVYEPWLETLGIERPQTTEEFAEMLRRFRDEDPNGNGEADEIALMGLADTVNSNFMRYLMNPFIYCQENYYIRNEDGTIGFAANQEGWKEGIQWIKSLYDEGLISPLTFTQDSTQLNAIVVPEPEVVGCLARMSGTMFPATDVRRGQYVCLDPLEGPSGLRQTQWTEQIPSIGMVITKNCENPEAAFRFGDYMCSELISVWNRYGEEGVDWLVPDENTVGTAEGLGFPPAMSVVSTWGVLQNSWWGQVGPYILTDKITCGQGTDPDGLAYNAAYHLFRTMEKELEYSVPIVNGLVYNEEEQEIINEYQSTINDYVLNSFSEFVTGVRDIEADWDSYVDEFDKMGLDEYMEAVNSCYARMYSE
ncbi:MAG TPA: extracellular solute-binding protein [Candidatus Ornithocaccomicrobium faecavium]|uniref:Extracellular solute-binding protein n=1 Tax=Candidatus Ornithocaccomicrobium faecavium TaxID=2840890 RepID=A0A9D1P860_9FIRM|nr:extracellular solute-binding protein [Candidatus Ornithocaccomicrobium faecavium]